MSCMCKSLSLDPSPFFNKLDELLLHLLWVEVLNWQHLNQPSLWRKCYYYEYYFSWGQYTYTISQLWIKLCLWNKQLRGHLACCINIAVLIEHLERGSTLRFQTCSERDKVVALVGTRRIRCSSRFEGVLSWGERRYETLWCEIEVLYWVYTK